MFNAKGPCCGRSWSIALIGVALGAGVQQVSVAQEAVQSTSLEEVLVTAERRSEDIQKTAVSVSVRDGDDLQQQGKFSLASILEDVPGLQGGAAATPIGTGGSGTDNQAAGLTIRGIPSNVGVGGGITSVASAAAIYVDGVYEGVGGAYDIERVEALRGPQGTLYGRSATSGLVAIHTRNPKLGAFTGNVGVEAGNYSLRHYTGGVNVPLGDTVALRISANKYQRDGFYLPQGGSSDSTDGRVKLLIQPSDTFSLLLGAAIQNNKTSSGGSTSRLPSPDGEIITTPQPSSVSPGENKYRQFWAEMSLDVGFAQLTYLPAYRTWTSDVAVYLRGAPPPGQPTAYFDQFSTTDKDKFWTHEVRLASKPDSKLVWQVGALYYDNTLHNFNAFYRQPSGGFYRSMDVARDTKATSGFAEATYPFTDATRVTGGLRFDQTKVQVNETFLNNLNCVTTIPGGTGSLLYCLPSTGNLAVGVLAGDAGRRVFNKWTYKLRAEHDFTPQNLAYAMISTGVSPGDISLAVDLRPTVVTNGVTVPNPNVNKPVPKEITSETLTAYEIGSKNRFLDDRLQLNGTIYYYDYGAYTVANANVNGSLDAQGNFVVIASPTQFETLSAPVKSYGVELETLFQLTANDRIGLNYSYTKAEFTDKNRPAQGTSRTFGDFFGLDGIPGLVPGRASLSYDHRFILPGGSRLTAGADVRWLSSHLENGLAAPVSKDQATSPAVMAAISPWLNAKAQFVTDFNVNWTSPKGMYSVTGWMRNASDNRYKQAVGIGSVNRTNYASATTFSNITVTPYDPRTYGVVVSVNW
jgi:iron complex outermembrane receptor protein